MPKARVSIELSERDTIMRQLRRKGKYTCRRAGATIRMWTVREPDAVKVGYQIHPRKHRTVSAIVGSVAKAIEAVNEAMQWHSPAEPSPILVPAPVIVQAAPQRQEWLPYADN